MSILVLSRLEAKTRKMLKVASGEQTSEERKLAAFVGIADNEGARNMLGAGLMALDDRPVCWVPLDQVDPASAWRAMQILDRLLVVPEYLSWVASVSTCWAFDADRVVASMMLHGIIPEEVYENIQTSISELSEELQLKIMQIHGGRGSVARNEPKRVLKIRWLRDEIFAFGVPDVELDRILEVCNRPESGVKVDTIALNEEFRIGAIWDTKEVMRAFRLKKEEEGRCMGLRDRIN